ncbi:MAG: M23 family metallopeptidase [Nitrospinota bacterium]|nr:M23 family metallopeptidase [Nitrospinota bacterium]
MKRKKYSVFLVSHDRISTHKLIDLSQKLSNFPRYNVNIFGVFLFVAIFVASCFLSAYLLFDRFELTNKLSKLPILENRIDSQSNVIKRFESKLSTINKNLNQLSLLEGKLRMMASMRHTQQSLDLPIGGIMDENFSKKSRTLTDSERKLFRRISRQSIDIERRSVLKNKSLSQILRIFQKNRFRLAHTPSIIPARGWITSGYGFRRSPFTSKREFHRGIDIYTRLGAPILSPADGIVIAATRDSRYGNYIKIRHLPGIITRYAHNQINLVRKGQQVRRGEIIAKVGNTGRSTGPHLHYEVIIKQKSVNPMGYIIDLYAQK